MPTLAARLHAGRRLASERQGRQPVQPRPRETMKLSHAERLAIVTTGLAILHHTDHVLRVDHSGWPFRADVSPFTYSLLVYPAIAVIFLARGRPRLRIGLAGLLALFPTAAHLFLETPADQYRTWATRPETNLLGVSSPALGALAVVVTVLLSVFAFATLLAFVRGRGA